MARPGRHRLPRPTRLLVLIIVSLVGVGLVLGTGSALARDRDNGSSSKADRGNRGNSDDDRNDRGKHDRKKDERKKDDDKFPGRDKAEPADDDDFVDIRNVRPDEDRQRNEPDASTGSFVAHCGTNANNHRNSDNFMVTPDERNGAQHVHDYVGNLSTNAFSDDDSLHAAGTTCDRNNKSTFFWPVLRATNLRGDDEHADGGGRDGNFGKILQPVSADMRFVGNPTHKVIPMPDDLSIITGDAKAKTNGNKNANAKWTCTGFENRTTDDKYPLCPAGSKIVRILEFPSCWDGRHLDSKDHREHMRFPDDDGSCKRGFKTIPKLRMTLTYDPPPGRNFALDTFPDQQHKPKTDHGDFMNIASKDVLDLAADCINSGRNC